MQPDIMLFVQVIVVLVALSFVGAMLGSFYLVIRGDYQLQQIPLGQEKRVRWWTLLPIQMLRVLVGLGLILQLCVTVLSGLGLIRSSSHSEWPWEVQAGLIFMMLVVWVMLNLPARRRLSMEKLHLSPQRPLHLAAFYLVVASISGCLISEPRPLMLPAVPEGLIVAVLVITLVAGITYALVAWLSVYSYGKQGGWIAIAERLQLRPSVAGVLYGAAAGVVAFLLYTALQSEVPGVPALHLLALLPLQQHESGLLGVLAALVMMLYGAAHELLYRGVLQPRIGWIWASLAGSMMMQSVVWGGGGLALLLALPYAFAAGWLAKRYGTWAAMTMALAFWGALGIAGM